MGTSSLIKQMAISSEEVLHVHVRIVNLKEQTKQRIFPEAEKTKWGCSKRSWRRPGPHLAKKQKSHRHWPSKTIRWHIQVSSCFLSDHVSSKQTYSRTVNNWSNHCVQGLCMYAIVLVVIAFRSILIPHWTHVNTINSSISMTTYKLVL